MKLKTVSGIMLSLLLIGMLTLAFNIQPVKSEPTTIIVPDDYDRIQWAIGNASDGDTIFVKAGTYYEHVVVDKSLSLVGENASTTIIDGGGTGNVIYLTADNTNISHFTIRNSGPDYPDSGIYAYFSNGHNISNNNIANNVYGIHLYHSSNNRVSGNNITNNKRGIYLNSSSNNTLSGNNITNNTGGIWLWGYSNHNTISGNNITANNWDGIYLHLSSNNVIAGNSITSYNGTGISFSWDSELNNLYGNNITNNHNGIFLESSHNTISRNNITNNENGVFIEYSHNVISGNILTDNQCGIRLFSMSKLSPMPWDTTIRHNTIKNNNIGIHLTYAEFSDIYNNNFINNSQQVYIDTPECANSWDDGYPSGGNYWNDHVCTGNPNDGSQPYIIDADNIDHYPFQDPNGWLLHQLTVTSLPITDVIFTINGTYKITPYTEWLLEGSHTLEMPATHNGYVWSHWLEDGDTNRIKTILLQGTTWTAVYEPAPKPVGGKATPINMPKNKPETPTLWIWLSTIILSLVVAVVYVKKRKRNTEINS